ncbi:uncharacterized protein LOC106009158 [Heterocephalus glaber]|uniref:Uncharacterized protein LOC106009158 n=1 Tax=Heterocephalus glaber TaxID=10181 RepID=A0AAX6QV92_HETGA|nr:uncharacterized protein LOC106009158 [Heterocephalus glaber]
MTEKNHVALEVLTQEGGPWNQPVAYLSKNLDPVAKVWPPCLQALVASVLLIQQADKLTLGQELTGQVPHTVLELLNTRGHQWLSNNRVTQYQALLFENLRLLFIPIKALNPATFLPMQTGPPDHNCLSVTDELFFSRPDLKMTPLSNADLVLFMDGSSFVEDGVHHAGYVITMKDEVILAGASSYWLGQHNVLSSGDSYRHSDGQRIRRSWNCIYSPGMR